MTVPKPPAGPSARVSYLLRLSSMFFFIGELVALYFVAVAIGLGYALLLLLGTSVLGAILMRSFGMKAARQYREAITAGTPVGPAVISGTIGLSGSVLLVLPGFISDVLGLLCVFPPTRFLLRPLITRFVESKIDSPTADRLFGARKVQPQWGERRHGPGRRSSDSVLNGEVVDGEVLNDDNGNGTGRSDNDGPKRLS